jgi:hypothetical protein
MVVQREAKPAGLQHLLSIYGFTLLQVPVLRQMRIVTSNERTEAIEP